MLSDKMKQMKLRSLTLTGLLGLALSLPALAEADDIAGRVNFSGFGTLGFTHTQGDGAAFIRDLTQPKGAANRGLSWELDSRLGVQANYKPLNQLEVVAQIVSRYRNENNFDPELTWGFLKYTVNETLELRAGRVGFDALLSADSRDIGYSMLWVRPPVDYYGHLFFSYMDGGDVVLRMPVGGGVSRLKLYSGVTRGRASLLAEQREWAGNQTTAPIGSMQDMDGSRGHGGFVDYQDNHWNVRFGIARLKILKDFPAGRMGALNFMHRQADRALADGDTDQAKALTAFLDDALLVGKAITYKTLGLGYEDGPLQTQMAIGRMSGDSLLVANSRAGFISAGYRIENLTPYVVISAIRSKRSSRADELQGLTTNAVASIANFMVGAPRADQNTLSLGARYDIAGNVALKIQMDIIDNKNCSPVSLPITGPAPSCAPPRYWARVPVSWDGRATVYSAVLDFAF